MEKKWIAISVMLVIICACVVMSIPVIKVAYTAKEPYSATETYYETEPYTTDLKYDVNGWISSEEATNPKYSHKTVLHVIITNKDTVDADFVINYEIHQGLEDAVILSNTLTKMVKSGSHYTFEHPFEHNYDIQYIWNVHPKNDKVTKYRDAPKQRTVTKYRDVTKYKYISIFEYIR